MKYEKPEAEMVVVLLQDVITASKDGNIQEGDSRVDEPNGAFGGLV